MCKYYYLYWDKELQNTYMECHSWYLQASKEKMCFWIKIRNSGLQNIHHSEESMCALGVNHNSSEYILDRLYITQLLKAQKTTTTCATGKLDKVCSA